MGFRGKDNIWGTEWTSFEDVTSEKIIENGAVWAVICSLEKKISVFRRSCENMYMFDGYAWACILEDSYQVKCGSVPAGTRTEFHGIFLRWNTTVTVTSWCANVANVAVTVFRGGTCTKDAHSALLLLFVRRLHIPAHPSGTILEQENRMACRPARHSILVV
jgi:hypothetical protein